MTKTRKGQAAPPLDRETSSARFRHALRRLEKAGIKVADDEARGASRYAERVDVWYREAYRVAAYLAHDPRSIMQFGRRDR